MPLSVCAKAVFFLFFFSAHYCNQLVATLVPISLASLLRHGGSEHRSNLV